MNSRWYWSCIILFVLAVLTTACSAPALPPATPTDAPTPTLLPKSTAAATALPTTAPSQTTAPTLAPTAAPAQPTKSTVTTANPTVAPTSKPGSFTKADVDKIFPPGRGQDLVFRACVNCHNWVPIVVTQQTKEEWERNSRDHRARVGLNDDDFQYLYQYLEENFNPSKPVPTNIPEDLLKQWTSY